MALEEFPYRYTTPSGTYCIECEGGEFLALLDDEIVTHSSDISTLLDELDRRDAAS